MTANAHKTTPARPRPNLYLVGFMGTGKSTVGRLLAERWRMRYVDSDQAIVEKAGRPIADIFATEGEPYFRSLELDFVRNGHPAEGCVVSCGGGLVVQPGMVEELKKRGLIACLFARPETILKRTGTNRNRPLLNVEDPLGRIRELLAEREPVYLKSGACFTTDSGPMQDLLMHIERFYLRESRRFLSGDLSRPRKEAGAANTDSDRKSRNP